jgi:putative oxidoreductase
VSHELRLARRFQSSPDEQIAQQRCGWGRLAWWAPLPVRMVVGYGFVAHACAKISRGPGVFAAVLAALGVPDPHLAAWITIVIELAGGVAVMLGAFVSIVSVPLVVVMIVAMIKVHVQYGFSSIKLIAVTATGPQFGPPGVETALLYIGCLATLALAGPGPWSVDHYLRRHRPPGADGPAHSIRNLT